MASSLGPLDIACDAPRYTIVRACEKVGIQSPEDVPWFRLSRFRNGAYERRRLLHLDTWKSLFGLQQSRRQNCSCGHALPQLARCTFTLRSGTQENYLIGQCSSCRRVFWEEA